MRLSRVAEDSCERYTVISPAPAEQKGFGQVVPHRHHLPGPLGLGEKIAGDAGGRGVVQVEDPHHVPLADDHGAA